MALALADGAPAAGILSARQRIEQQLAPVPVVNAAAKGDDLRTQWEAALDERLRRLAVKIAPAMSVQQGDAWRVVMVEALADLPAMMALTAAKKAIHLPLRFLNEVEAAVRDIAAGMIERRRLGLKRLDAMEAALARASEPQLPDPAAEPWTLVRVHEANAVFEQSGLSMRYRLVGDQVESFDVRTDPHEAARRAAVERDQQRAAA